MRSLLLLGSAVLPLMLASRLVTGRPVEVKADVPLEPEARSRMMLLHREASSLLARLDERPAPALVAELRSTVEALATAGRDFWPESLRRELSDVVARLRESPDRSALAAAATLLAALQERLRDPLALDFQGSYSQTKVKEPVYGGHASAMGPPPVAAPGASDGPPSPVTFVEVPGLAARSYAGGPTKDHILESGGSGVALLDYDADGRLDAYVVTAYELDARRAPIPHANALYRNLDGQRFLDVTATAGVGAAAWGNGVCAGDYDDDGRLDLYVTNWGPNLLYRNRGDGTFVDVASSAGVAASGWSTGCTFFDADADGDLDLYLVRYVRTTWDDLRRAERTLTWRGGPKTMVGPLGLPGESDLFFENRGDGTFVEATQAAGLADSSGAYGFGVVATDYDDDGRIDLFVANDTNPNFLYRNVGGRFESEGLLAGVAVNAEGRTQAGMGVDAGDYDGDGRLDLVLTTFAHDTYTLFRSLDGRQFEDATVAAGLAAPTFERMGWGVSFFDPDLDGDLDLFFANGHIYPNVDEFPSLGETFHQKNQLLLNESGRFRDVSESAGPGLAVRKANRGLAVGDIDGDGDPDLLVSSVDDAPTLLRNEQKTGHHFVAFRLERAGRNRHAIGARVTVEGGGRRQAREVRSGGSYLSQGDLRPCFGLGRYGGPVDVEVRLPGGARWRFTGLSTDRLHLLSLKDSERVS